MPTSSASGRRLNATSWAHHFPHIYQVWGLRWASQASGFYAPPPRARKKLPPCLYPSVLRDALGRVARASPGVADGIVQGAHSAVSQHSGKYTVRLFAGAPPPSGA